MGWRLQDEPNAETRPGLSYRLFLIQPDLVGRWVKTQNCFAAIGETVCWLIWYESTFNASSDQSCAMFCCSVSQCWWAVVDRSHASLFLATPLFLFIPGPYVITCLASLLVFRRCSTFRMINMNQSSIQIQIRDLQSALSQWCSEGVDRSHAYLFLAPEYCFLFNPSLYVTTWTVSFLHCKYFAVSSP